jgi:hypothetical protein
MGEKTVNSQFLPDVENVVVTKQYIGGSLFKSQNGSIWTPSQFEDLKFTLYKADFTSSSGTAFFFNPDVSVNDINAPFLPQNAIKTLPRKLKVGIQTSTNMDSILVPGLKVSEGPSFGPTGNIEAVGGPISVSGLSTTNVGVGYSNGTFNNVVLYSLSGGGSTVSADITFSSGSVNSVILNSYGSGHITGDLLGITTSNVIKGSDAEFTIIDTTGIDTLYLSNVIGNEFTPGSGLVYYSNDTRLPAMSTTITYSQQFSDLYVGNNIEILQYGHGMQSANNLVRIAGIEPDTIPSTLTQNITSDSIVISVASTEPFSVFEGITTTTGFAKVNNEIIFYNDVGEGTLGIGTRGIDNSIIRNHFIDDKIYKYELNGISLHRINKIHNMGDSPNLQKYKTMDRYYLSIDNASDRNSGDTPITFFTEKHAGGSKIVATQNNQYNSILPQFNTLTPSEGTSINTQIRTVSGTSSGGSESSFEDLGFEPVELNVMNDLSSTRLICSKENEDEFLDSMYRNKSFTIGLTLQSDDRNLSPVIDTQNSMISVRRNMLNNPVSDYASDNRVNTPGFDPHSAIYITNRVNLKQPATSLKVYVTAYRPASADFRVLYKLFRPDSSEVEQNYELFPGYDNLRDTTGNGFGDTIINESKNSGLPDAFVKPSEKGEFLEYQFSIDNLPQFTGFILKLVMSGTDEANSPTFKDIRAIALA